MVQDMVSVELLTFWGLEGGRGCRFWSGRQGMDLD